MVRYYGGLVGRLREVVWTSAGTASRWLFGVVCGLAVLALVNQPVGRQLMIDWQGISPVVGVVLLAALVLFGVVRANYHEFAAMRGQVETLEGQMAAAPHPVVHVREEFGGIVIDVTNEGAAALVECEVRFLRVDRFAVRRGVVPTPADRYKPVWGSGQVQTKLLRGGTDSIALSAREDSAPGGLIDAGITFPFTDRYHPHPAFYIGWILTDPPSPYPRVELEVTILTDPPSKELVRRFYAVNALGKCVELDAPTPTESMQIAE